MSIMPMIRPLTGHTVAISVSNSPDLAELGFGEQHLRDAMVEIARHLLAAGARLVYGGDLRPLGFTDLLFELVARHHLEEQALVDEPPVTNYLAWPVHIRFSTEELARRIDELRGVAQLVLLTESGDLISAEDRGNQISRRLSKASWGRSLTAMRQAMNQQCDARVLLGGTVEGYRGVMPGIAEEAILALISQKPVFLLGGFGGCARDIAETMKLIERRAVSRANQWPSRRKFASFRLDALGNGLAANENVRLAQTPHVDEMVALVLRGLSVRLAEA
jgi:hypothetical protein